MPTASSNVRFQGQLGKHLFSLSFSQFDPTETFDCCRYQPLCLRRPLTERQVLRCARCSQCYDPAPVGGVMAGCGYTIFDTAVGRCGIAWGDAGIVGVQLPEVREIETRRRLFRLYPDARELPPPLRVESAIEGIAALFP